MGVTSLPSSRLPSFGAPNRTPKLPEFPDPKISIHLPKESLKMLDKFRIALHLRLNIARGAQLSNPLRLFTISSRVMVTLLTGL